MVRAASTRCLRPVSGPGKYRRRQREAHTAGKECRTGKIGRRLIAGKITQKFDSIGGAVTEVTKSTKA